MKCEKSRLKQYFKGITWVGRVTAGSITGHPPGLWLTPDYPYSAFQAWCRLGFNAIRFFGVVVV